MPQVRQQRACSIGCGVEQQGGAGADGGDDRAAQCRPERECGEARDREVAVRLLKQLRPDDLAHEAVERGVVEGDSGSTAGLQRDQLPDARVTRDDEDTHTGPHGATRSVAGDHDGAARQAIAEHAAEGERCDLRDRPGRKGEADLGRAAAEVEDCERDRDRREVRADIRDRAAREEEPEVAVAEGLHSRMVPRYEA